MTAAASLKAQTRVAARTLSERIETVKLLRENETARYEIAKDRQTDEHYLIYAYDHLVIAEGRTETYIHLMPLESDDVLGLLFGSQPYKYPEAWTKPYLRSSSDDDSYVWFDPSGLEAMDVYETIGKEIKDKLTGFKTNGKIDPDAVRRLLGELDKL